MYRYFTKILVGFILCTSSVFSQSEEQETATDTIVYKQKYGIRLGADISKIARSFFDDNYQGFEINGDYRLTQTLYLAGELGNEERTLENEVLNTTSKGSYFKAGVDINLYKNWLDMENMIFAGFRVGASTFSQTLNSYTIYDVNNQYFGEQFTVTNPEETTGLSAIWGELIFGAKAEVFTNLYMGLNVQLKFLVTDTSPDNFENLYIPGFNRTYDSGNIGAGFGYNVSYLIPIYKKTKKIKETESEEETENN
ncbi:DUF6048 family protein [Winogradskyella litorisediminis]|uniref:DUF6048 family protein n=1 Tax=Winogradskyella litorisediminis TaxID=1156618 RepID=A0ABW3NAY7_9FLAO